MSDNSKNSLHEHSKAVATEFIKPHWNENSSLENDYFLIFSEV